MNKLSLILSAVTVGAMIVFMAPSVFALNRGHILRNVALWLAIFCGLGLIYKNFGPGSPHPLFSTPMSRAGMDEAPPAPATQKDSGNPASDQSYTPPKD